MTKKTDTIVMNCANRANAERAEAIELLKRFVEAYEGYGMVINSMVLPNLDAKDFIKKVSG